MTSQPLPDAAVARLVAHAVSEGELREMRVATGVPGRWLPPLFRASAMTFGRHVLFRAGRYDPDSPSGLALIAHEAEHITRWRELGIPRFLATYASGVITSRGSHAEHPLERPLNERQRTLRAALDAAADRVPLDGYPTEVVRVDRPMSSSARWRPGSAVGMLARLSVLLSRLSWALPQSSMSARLPAQSTTPGRHIQYQQRCWSHSPVSQGRRTVTPLRACAAT